MGGRLHPFCHVGSVELAAAHLPPHHAASAPPGKFTQQEKGPCHCRRRKSQRTPPNVNVKPCEREDIIPARKVTWKIENGTEETCGCTRRPRVARERKLHTARAKSQPTSPNACVKPSERNNSVPGRTIAMKIGNGAEETRIDAPCPHAAHARGPRTTRVILLQSAGGNFAWNHPMGGHLHPFCHHGSVVVSSGSPPPPPTPHRAVSSPHGEIYPAGEAPLPLPPPKISTNVARPLR
jgi:hypothetical protein